MVIPKPRPQRGVNPNSKPSSAGLFDALDAIPSLPRSLCAGDSPETWDEIADPAVIQRNQRICRVCPELDRCRSYAESLGPGKLLGTVAGQLHRPQPPSKKGAA